MTTLKQCDIVQIVDESQRWFPCLVVVDESKPWGIQGYVYIPHNDGEPTGRAYIRLRTEQIEKVGEAVVSHCDMEEETK